MKIGLLRHRVVIQRATTAPDDLGEPIQTWATLATAWGRVEPIGGNERFSAMQVQGEVTHRITVRYQSALSDLAPDDRVTWSGNTYDITHVLNPDERNRELHIFAKQHT